MTYQYKMCGLDYVFLHGGYQEYETDYGKGVSIEHADELDRQIAASLIWSHSRLRGQEVRFLRSLMHMSQTEVALNLGLKRLTVVRWEGAPHTPIPGPSDRLLRIVAARELFEGLDAIGLIIDIFPEITDKRVGELHMTYGGKKDDGEPDLFSNDNREYQEDGWKRQLARG